MAQFTVRVLIADDHEMVRSGLASFLNGFPGLEIVGMAGDGEETLGLCNALRPDVLITDLYMPVMDGVEVTRRVLHEHPETKVIVISGSLDESRRQDAFRAGAVMCLQKDNAYRDLPDLILEVCSPPAV